MKSEKPLDYAVFQLSPKRSRCELLVSCDGSTEKLASGLVKPFVAHLKVAEEQFALAAQSIKLEADKRRNADTWFTKGTIERFVRFVSTPEVLELANTFDAEMSQLEAAQRIYSQGAGDQLSGLSGGNGAGSIAAADATKKELLRAIDVRLVALKQDLTTACARAAAAGFGSESVSELQLFSDRFGAHRLNEACGKFLSVCQRRSELATSWNSVAADRALRSSYSSDMSIDESPDHHGGSHTHGHAKQNESEASTCQPLKRSLGAEKDSDKKEEEAAAGTSPAAVSAAAVQTNSRRLSVQDRINLFENKQKQTSGSGSGSGSGGKPIVSKSIELRRQSSDASSAGAAPPERAVLRRWSGVSDMSISIDLSNDRKDGESPLCTPSSASASQPKPEDRAGTQKEQKPSEAQVRSSVERVATEPPQNQSKPSHDIVSLDKGAFREKVKVIGQELGRFKDQLPSEEQIRGHFEPTESEIVPPILPPTASKKPEEVGHSRIRLLATRTVEESHPASPEFFSQPPSTPEEVGGKEAWEGSRSRPRGINSVRGEGEVKARRYLASEERQPSSINKIEALGTQSIKLQRHSSGPEVTSQGWREVSDTVSGNSKSVFPGKMVPENQETINSTTGGMEQVQRARQAKGNQELNDELKLKASELEKLFAEHKLRLPSDQPNSSRKSKINDVQMEQVASSQNKKSADAAPSHLPDERMSSGHSGSSSASARLTASSRRKFADNQDFEDSLKQNVHELGFSDDSRGKFYEKYMQKRDAKLREEWGSKGAEKEAKMKAMHDNLERSRSEMKTKFSGSGQKDAHKRTDRHRSFNIRSALKREQQPMNSVDSEEDEGLSSELSEQKLYGQDRFLSETSQGDGASRSTQPKKTPNRSMPSSTPRAAAVPVSRSSVKVPSSGSVRRRGQQENPLAQSVPNFSDLRKENTKPSSGGSKAASRSQVRNYARSRSTSEDAPLGKEEKPRRSQSLKKGAANPVEILSSLSSDGVALTPVKLDKEQAEQSFDNKIESRPFLRKGNGIGPGSGPGIAKLRTSLAPETIKDEEAKELHYDAEDSVDIVNEEEEYFDTSIVEDPVIVENEEPRLSEEFDKSGNSGSENGEVEISPSQMEPSVVESPAAVPLAFQSVESAQDSPGESPVSWNSRMHLAFSYPHETSDVDVSADSPMGSPASWNSHSLTQTEAEAARMRKKWGSAQKPVVVVSSSQNQSRKDVTKGFKRLLKFGRKSRGADTLADWISATTSEGDDDTEDGRDPANRSSEDLRKSRMGFPQGHPSDDGFNESELFNEHVQALSSSIPAPPVNYRMRDDHLSGSSLKAPRSFFSLSTFRSKGSDSKPR